MMASFATPSLVPQDLLLIQSLLGVLEQQKLKPQVESSASEDDDDIASSGSECASEDEVEDVLMVLEEDPDEVTQNASLDAKPEENKSIQSTVPADSDSESDDDSESSLTDEAPVKNEDADNELEEEGERGPAVQSKTYYTTPHEIVEGEITIPDIEEVGPDEVMDKIGEIMSILDNLVIVKGLPSSSLDRALDTDTLLVLDDRKVLGFVYETFGPTAQPFYQVKFNTSYQLELEKARVGRPVFHIPARSHFVPLNQLHRLRGSDASNVYDEEPAGHELEFSDDEAEAEYKRNAKQVRRGQREGSVASTSSRYGTPAPERERDMTDAFGTNSAYDDSYMDTSTSRPAPIPYDDDPYSDNFGTEPPPVNEFQNDSTGLRPRAASGNRMSSVSRPPRDRGRGRGGGRNQRGRGRGQAFSRPSAASVTTSPPPMIQSPIPPYQQPNPSVDNVQFNPAYAWQQFQQHPMVQPHINPRFFGMGFGMPFAPNQQQQYWGTSWPNSDAQNTERGPAPQ